MKVIKVESCLSCMSKHTKLELLRNDCPIVRIEKEDRAKFLNSIHKDCTLENYPDIEAIKEICNQPYDSSRELQADILTLIGKY